MKTKTINVYEYKELSDKAKERAREWYLNDSFGDSFRFEDTLEDAKNIGLKIESLEDHRRCEGYFLRSAFDCANMILKEHGETCETYKTAQVFLKAVKEYEVKMDKDSVDLEDDKTIDSIKNDFLRALLEDYRVMLNANIYKSIERIEVWLKENSNLKIVAYGAGGRGIMTIAALKEFSNIKYIVDKNPKAKNIYSPKSNLPVFDIERLGINRADKILVFSFGYYNEIISELGKKFNYLPEQFTSILELLELKHA